MSKLLICDDDPSILYMMKQGLEHVGFSVDAASSATDTIELCRNNSYDLALIDYSLNDDYSGLDLVRELHKDKYIPFAMFTSSVNEELILQAGRMGAVNYFVKPIHIDSLIPQVKISIIRGKHIMNLEFNHEFAMLKSMAAAYISARKGIQINQGLSLLNKNARKAQMPIHELARLILDEHDENSRQSAFNQHFNQDS